MTTAHTTLGVLAAAFFVACATASPPLAPASGPPPSSTATPITGKGCAFGVRDTQVSIQNVERGVIVTFMSATPSSVDDLRERVKAVAAQHGPGAHQGPGHDGAHGSGDGHGFHFSEMPPIETSFQVIEGGARLHVLAGETSDVRAVQKQMWSRTENVAAGECH